MASREAAACCRRLTPPRTGGKVPVGEQGLGTTPALRFHLLEGSIWWQVPLLPAPDGPGEL